MARLDERVVGLAADLARDLGQRGIGRVPPASLWLSLMYATAPAIVDPPAKV